jgi:hypothetical protein
MFDRSSVGHGVILGDRVSLTPIGTKEGLETRRHNASVRGIPRRWDIEGGSGGG